MKQNKKTINEAQLRAIVKEAVKSVMSEEIKGRYLTHYPERSGFDATASDFHKGEGYNSEEMKQLIQPALQALSKARDYARVNGEGKMYTLLNSIIGELYEYEF